MTEAQKKLWDAIYQDKQDILKLIAQDKSLFDYQDPETGDTFLIHAIKQQRYCFVQEFLSFFIQHRMFDSVRAANKKCETAFSLLISAGQTESALMIIDLEKSQDSPNKTRFILPDGTSYFHFAVKKGNKKVVAYFINDPAVSSAIDNLDSSGNASLHYACQFGYVDVARILINHEANVQLRTQPVQSSELKRSALAMAAEFGHGEVVKALLDKIQTLPNKDEELNYFDKLGMTPLHYACQNGHAEVACLLIVNGASVDLRNNKLQVPIDVALENQQTALIKSLAACGIFVGSDVSQAICVI